jgi:hypothetical protein
MARSVSNISGSAPDQIMQVFRNLQIALCDVCLISPALAIGTTTTKVKTAAATKLLIDGALVHKAITDDAFVLSGTVVNAKFNVFVLTINASGTCTARMGTDGATRAAVVWPSIPVGEVVVGFVEINPTGTGNFVGGTTALTDGTVVPNAVYVNTPYVFNPNIFTLPNAFVS